MLEAGRELDALIAEKVMGLTKYLIKKDSLPNKDCPSLHFPRQDSYGYAYGDQCVYFEGHCNDVFIDKYGCSVPQIPPFSDDIAEAWLVVEKLSAQVRTVQNAVGFRVDWKDTYDGNGKWVAGFIDSMDADCSDDHFMYHYNSEADTAPLAICRAAIHWIENVTTKGDQP